MSPELLAQARRQQGLLTLVQCDAAGIDRADMRRRLRRKEWRQIRSGVISVTAVPTSSLGALVEQSLAVLLLLPAGAVICGRTAAVMWRLTECPAADEAIHVLLPPGVEQRRLVGVQTHAGGPAKAVVVNGVPCTDLTRTVLDACTELSLDRAVALLDAAERAEPGLLHNCRGHAKARTGRGCRRIRAALRLATGLPESTLESIAWVLWHTAGLPVPLMQAVIRRGGRFIARVDFLWPEAMLVVEVDGLGKYGERGELQREKARQNMLVAEGYVVLRFTWADVVHRPDAVLRQVRAALMINRQISPSNGAPTTAKGAC